MNETTEARRVRVIAQAKAAYDSPSPTARDAELRAELVLLQVESAETGAAALTRATYALAVVTILLVAATIILAIKG